MNTQVSFNASSNLTTFLTKIGIDENYNEDANDAKEIAEKSGKEIVFHFQTLRRINYENEGQTKTFKRNLHG